VGRRAVAALVLFGIIAAACAIRLSSPVPIPAEVEGRRVGPTSDPAPANVSVNTDVNAAANRAETKILTGTVGSTQNIVVGTQSSSVVVSGEQTANGADIADIAVSGSNVSVVSHVSGSSSVSVTASATTSGSSSVVNVSVTTASGSVNRTVRLDKEGRFVLRVTAGDDGLPVIQVEEVGP
jgi:hypothetical protein